jgi:hypothetical protein
MDFARSCYSTLMRFEVGGEPVPIRWFFVPEGKPMLPFGHTFFSRNWEDEAKLFGDRGEVGEVRGAPRRWSVGRPGADFGYRHPDGPRAYYVGGPPTPGWTPIPMAITTVPLDCVVDPHPTMVGSGGVEIDSSASTSSVPSGVTLVTGDLVGDGEAVGVVMANMILEKRQRTLSDPIYNDYALGDGGAYRFHVIIPTTITGFDGGEDGRLVVLENHSLPTITIPHLSGGSLAGDRVWAIDQVAVRLWPGMSTILLWNAGPNYWREITTVPVIQQKGDLITATDTRPSVLHSGTLRGQVLSVDQATSTGLEWGDPWGGTGGPGDINYFRTSGSGGISLGPRWYSNSFAIGFGTTFGAPVGSIVFALPFISPRGGRIDQIGVYGQGSPTIADECVLGIYRSDTPADGLPTDLLVVTSPVSINPGLTAATIDFALEPGILYWLAVVVRNVSSMFGLRTYIGPFSSYWPLWGLDQTFSPLAPYPYVSTAHTYDGTLPDPFSATPTIQGSAIPPIIAVHYSS